MKAQFEPIISFLKKFPGVIYSLLLAFVIPIILFVTIYFSISRFEKNFNHLLQTKALLLENVVSSFFELQESMDEDSAQAWIEKMTEQNSDIDKVSILKMDSEKNEFIVVASSNKEEIGNKEEDLKDVIAIATGYTEGIAQIEADDNGRFWAVSKKIGLESGEGYVIKTRLPTSEVDEGFARSIRQAYWAVILASLILILLVTNYVRLSRYVLLFNKIKEIDEMKDDFISLASHELRTPLTAISGYIEMIGKSPVAKRFSPEEKKYVENIRASSDRLKNLVEDILEVSRIEQNRIPFKLVKLDAIELAKKMADYFSTQAKEKGLKVRFENNSGSDRMYLVADKERLEQILVNLIGNSVKYTLKGEVVIKTFGDDDRANIAVEDTGVGMSAQQQKGLFGKFYRVQNEKTRHVSGTGLGLWITKQLVEKMGGEISLESMEGVGSRFTVSFPTANK